MDKGLAKAKLVLAVILVFGHLLIIATVSLIWIMQGFFTDQYLNLIGTVSPIFAAYVSIILSHYSRRKLHDKMPPSDSTLPLYAGAAAGLLGIFIVEIGAIMSGVIGSLAYSEYLKVVIATETLFGVYLGTVVPNYFYHE